MMRPASLIAALSLVACGLERDWERWQQASQSGTGDTGSSGDSTTTSIESTGSSSSNSSGLDGDDSTGTTSAHSTSVGATSETGESGGDTSTGATPFCGDGIVDAPLEECDDGNPDSDDDCVFCYRSRLIYITSTILGGGDINGLMGADAYCRSLAAKAIEANPSSPIVDPSNFKALLSTTTVTVFDRHFPGKGPYHLVNGLKVSDSFAALFTDPHENPINVDENSQTHHGGVWTGTDVDGSPYPGIDFCGDWKDPWGSGNIGTLDALDSQWIHRISPYNPSEECLSELSIYCVEQE